MFTIQGLLHFYKDRVCGPNLEYPSYSSETFSNNLLSDNECRLPEFNFSGLLDDENNGKKEYSHIFF